MAGRTKGSTNRATRMKERHHEGQGLVPLAYMLQVLRDEKQSHEERMKAAVAAAPYVHPRLATIQHQGDENKPLVVKTIERRIVKAG